MITERSIREVKDVADIVDIIGAVVKIKKSGSNWSGCCPFHNEKSPSFNVNQTKGIYKCFGCGESGDAISFVRKYHTLDYPEAIEFIADFHGISLEYEQNNTKSVEEIKVEKERDTTARELLETAAKRYNRELPNHKEVHHYLLSKRKLKPGTILEWQIGYAPHADFLHPDIKKAGKQRTAEDIGLIKVTSDRMWDQMRSRITIPIINHRAQYVGLGGRKLPTDTEKSNPKYINPSSSFIYDKSRVLFGLHQAISAKAFKRHGMAILSEGYFDVISMHQNGYDCTVATCGTALTDEQAKLLKKYTDTILIMRDADEAGKKATMRDIDILIKTGFMVYVVELPKGKDADDMSHDYTFIGYLITNIKQGVPYKADSILNSAKDDIAKALALDEVGRILANVQNETLRIIYTETIAKDHNLKTKLKNVVEKQQKQLDREKKEEELRKAQKQVIELPLNDGMPRWANRTEAINNGFLQIEEERDGDPMGIYFEVKDDYWKRVARFTVKPLYHIPDASNNRRLIEVYNGRKRSVIEMPSRAFVSMDMFLTALMERGSYSIEPTFSKSHYVRLMGWLSEEMPHCHELKTLGWQPEGFFSYYNRVVVPTEEGIKEYNYNEMGIVEIDGQHFISMGASSAHSDQRGEDNQYENDMFLAYKQTSTTFEQWADLFCKVYGDNAPFGISYIFMSIFKDLVTAETKCPILYSYGPKGSGKSEFCESILYFFFSGKNSEGKLMQGYNLNPGQGTPFSFFNLLSRFRNTPIHFNEFDENNIEDWAFGAFKAFYDGQGREVGDGSTGKARKTTIQKTQGTLVVAGQYLSTRDDGSVLSRSITCQFNSSRVDNLTETDVANFQRLKKMESDGLSGLVAQLLVYRKNFKSQFKTMYWDTYNALFDDIRHKYGAAETRLVRNYACILSVYKLMGQFFKLPFSYEKFYEKCMQIVMGHNALLKENNSLSRFWAGVEQMFDRNIINYDNINRKYINREFKIQLKDKVQKKESGKVFYEELVPARKVLFIRFGLLYGQYAKWHKEKYGKSPQDESTLLKYMQDQPYYIGLNPSYHFDDKQASCFMINYESLGFNLENIASNHQPDNAQNGQTSLLEEKADDTPPF